MAGSWLVLCLVALSLEVRMVYTGEEYSQPTPAYTESNGYTTGPQEYTQQTSPYGAVDYVYVEPPETEEKKGLFGRRAKYPEEEEAAKPGDPTQEENKGLFYNFMNKPNTTHPVETNDTNPPAEGTGDIEYRGIFGRRKNTKPETPYLECTPTTNYAPIPPTTSLPYTYPVSVDPYAPLPTTAPPLYMPTSTVNPYAPPPTTTPPYSYPVTVDYYATLPAAPPLPPCIYPSTPPQKEESKPPRKGLFSQWRKPPSEPYSTEPNAGESPQYSYTTAYYPPPPTSSPPYTYPTTKNKKEEHSQEKPPRKGLFSQWMRRKPYSETTVPTDYYAPALLYPAPTTMGYYAPPPPSPTPTEYYTPSPTTTEYYSSPPPSPPTTTEYYSSPTITTTIGNYTSTLPPSTAADDYTSTLPPTTATNDYTTLTPTPVTTTESYLTTPPT